MGIILIFGSMPMRLLLLAVMALGACAAPTAPAAPAFFLLGEVHDNPAHHEARAALLRAWLADGRRTTVVFEQFDRAQDLTLAAAPREAEALVDAGRFDKKGWRWPLHKPLIDAALAGGATIVGGNLERATVRRAVREGAGALPAEVAALLAQTPWSARQQQALEREIDDGHCKALPASLHAGMALAQRARDAAMARALLDSRAAGAERVILIAGNGHVRRDRAVPLYLRAAGVAAADIDVRGYLEPTGDAAPYDSVVRADPPPRDDPCKDLLRH